MRRIPKILELNALSITLFYLVFALLWILLSDQFLIWLTKDPLLISKYQTWKGIFYVIVTGIFLYWLIQRSNEKLTFEKEQIDQALFAAEMASWSIELETGKNTTSEKHHRLFGLKQNPKKWGLSEFFEFVHPDDRERIEKAFNNAIETEMPYEAEYRIIWPDDSVHWMRSRGSVQKDEHGEKKRIAGIISDITEKKKLEVEFAKETELFESIFEHIPVMIDIYDPEINKIRVNKAFEKIMGWTNQEIMEIDLMAECYPDEELRKQAIQSMKKANGEWDEFEVVNKAGEKRIQSWSNIRLSDDTTIGIGLDITEKKKQEKELQDLAERYQNAEKIARFGHWKRNVITDEAIWSDGFYDIIGLEKGTREPSYKNLLEMIHPDDREEFDDAFKKALETGSLNVRYRLIKPSTGEVGYFQELAKTEYNEKGAPVYISGTIQDMTEREEFQIKLKQRNDFIENTIENLPIGVAVNLIDEGTVTLMNSKFSEIYGWPKESLTDLQSFFECVYPDEDYRQSIMEMIIADIASENPERMQWNGIRITTQDGEERIVNAKNIPVYNQNLMISTVVDVTAQFKAEQLLAESEYNYRLLFQKSPLPMWIYNPEDLRIIEVNNAAVKHYGYSRKEFAEMNLLDIRPQEDHEALKKLISGHNLNQISESGEWRHLKKNGDIIYVRVTGSSINYFGNNYRLVLMNDVTQQKKAEEMVLASLVEGENKERARIARELHDGLGQYLAAANMNLDAVKDEISQLDDRKQQQFDKGLKLLKHAVHETTQISRNLMPRVVDDYGLALAIETLVDNYSNNSEVNIKYYQNIHDFELTRQIEFNMYRIAQEGISNAVKYARASQINVQLIKDEFDLILTIDDNGKGFDITARDFSPGLGLQTIKTRVGALGGEFECDSKPGKGTLLNVIVPLKK